MDRDDVDRIIGATNEGTELLRRLVVLSLRRALAAPDEESRKREIQSLLDALDIESSPKPYNWE